jgi:hypothetical protein
MLEIASPATSGSRGATGGIDPIGRGTQDVHRVGPQEGGRFLGDSSEDPFARERMADEDHFAVRSPGDAPAARGDVASV